MAREHILTLEDSKARLLHHVIELFLVLALAVLHPIA
jgi:hypothetical protein